MSPPKVPPTTTRCRGWSGGAPPGIGTLGRPGGRDAIAAAERRVENARRRVADQQHLALRLPNGEHRATGLDEHVVRPVPPGDLGGHDAGSAERRVERAVGQQARRQEAVQVRPADHDPPVALDGDPAGAVRPTGYEREAIPSTPGTPGRHPEMGDAGRLLGVPGVSPAAGFVPCSRCEG